MLNFNSPIKEEKKFNDLNIIEVEPTIKINLRSNKREFSTKIGKILSILPPMKQILRLVTKNLIYYG